MSSKALSAKDASTIRYFSERYGYSQRELAALYEVDRKTIWRIVNYLSYKDAPTSALPTPADHEYIPVDYALTSAETPADDDFYQGIEIDPPDIRWFGWILLWTLCCLVGSVALIILHAYGRI